jgi:hypothetical protein
VDTRITHNRLCRNERGLECQIRFAYMHAKYPFAEDEVPPALRAARSWHWLGASLGKQPDVIALSAILGSLSLGALQLLHAPDDPPGTEPVDY